MKGLNKKQEDQLLEEAREPKDLNKSFDTLNDDVIKTAENMERHGGSFVKTLGKALIKADPLNRMKLISAFPEYYQRYQNWDNDNVKKYKQYLKDCVDDEDFELSSIFSFEEWEQMEEEKAENNEFCDCGNNLTTEEEQRDKICKDCK